MRITKRFRANDIDRNDTDLIVLIDLIRITFLDGEFEEVASRIDIDGFQFARLEARTLIRVETQITQTTVRCLAVILIDDRRRHTGVDLDAETGERQKRMQHSQARVDQARVSHDPLSLSPSSLSSRICNLCLV